MSMDKTDPRLYEADGRPVDEESVVPPAIVIVRGSRPGIVYIE